MVWTPSVHAVGEKDEPFTKTQMEILKKHGINLASEPEQARPSTVGTIHAGTSEAPASKGTYIRVFPTDTTSKRHFVCPVYAQNFKQEERRKHVVT